MSLFPGPYKNNEDDDFGIVASNSQIISIIGEHTSSEEDRQIAVELCALLNAGWEAKQQEEREAAMDAVRANPIDGPAVNLGPVIHKWDDSPESRIARDLGVPVEELIAHATAEKEGRCAGKTETLLKYLPITPDTLPEDGDYWLKPNCYIEDRKNGFAVELDDRCEPKAFPVEEFGLLDYHRISRAEAADLWRTAAIEIE